MLNTVSSMTSKINIGFDLSITSVNIQKKNFTWTTNFNVSHNRNKIEALSGEQYFLEEALTIVNIFKPAFENPDSLKIGQNIKYDLIMLANYGVTLKGKNCKQRLQHDIR